MVGRQSKVPVTRGCSEQNGLEASDEEEDEEEEDEEEDEEEEDEDSKERMRVAL